MFWLQLVIHPAPIQTSAKQSMYSKRGVKKCFHEFVVQQWLAHRWASARHNWEGGGGGGGGRVGGWG